MVNDGAGDEIAIVPEGAQIVASELNRSGVDLSVVLVTTPDPAIAQDAPESAGDDKGASIPTSAEAPPSAQPSKPAGQSKSTPKPQPAKGKPVQIGKKK
jgi:hypothetical protein